ncbi:MAG TPA: nucleotidyltransferase family protein [Microthrixaceae bacterium]|nr:nucleotidyltransferase family protein [Microthrixaceae bacterium]
MHAVILAGGRGVRLRPYTTAFPKPLVPIGDEFAIIEIVLRQLKQHGFTGVTIAIGHLGQLIRAYCGDGSQWGLEINYWSEDQPLGTMGPVVTNLESLPEYFLVMNGDVLTDLDYRSLLQGHMDSTAPLTVAAYDRTVKIDFGVLGIGGETGDRIVAFREKPVEHFSVSMGVYAASKATLRRYNAGEPLGFDELVLDLMAQGDPPRVHRFAGYWLDIGRPDDYDQANDEWETLRGRLLPSE